MVDRGRSPVPGDCTEPKSHSGGDPFVRYLRLSQPPGTCGPDRQRLGHQEEEHRHYRADRCSAKESKTKDTATGEINFLTDAVGGG